MCVKWSQDGRFIAWNCERNSSGEESVSAREIHELSFFSNDPSGSEARLELFDGTVDGSDDGAFLRAACNQSKADRSPSDPS